MPGSSHWSVVTPEGVADNGGLVVGTAGGSVVVGFLPSQLLRYSPLAQSIDGGATWSPQLLPAGLTPLPDVLASTRGRGRWSTRRDRRGQGAFRRRRACRAGPCSSPPPASPPSLVGCGVTTIDAVAILPTGSPLVATGCRRNGVVGIFTKTGGAWRPYGTMLRGQSRSATDVLRLEASGTTAAALAATSRGGQRALVALWREGGAPWTAAVPLILPAGASVLASAVGADGAMAVILDSPQDGVAAYSVEPGGAWARLAQPPAGTTAIALPSGPATIDGPTIDAFTVQGGSLGVYALGPIGSKWVRVQSSQIAIPYGSSG